MIKQCSIHGLLTSMLLIVFSLMSNDAIAQKAIRGTVLDEANEPIIGASVLVKGTTNGSITGVDGTFNVKANPSDVLVISYVGYATVEQQVGNQTQLVIHLREDSKVLNDVVVIGYGSTTKKELTGSVTSMKKDDLNPGTFTNAMGMLQGKVAGLQIINPNGADPTAKYEVLLRGTNTLSAGQGPLIIIDGVAGADIRNINFQEVESIDEQSKFHRCIIDVIKYWKQYPDDWRKCWLEIENRHALEIGCPEGVFNAFNIDATINAAYCVMGLLYGNGDFFKTMDIATRCGQDSDCNPATAAGILGVIQGYKAIPEYWKPALERCENIKFPYTDISLSSVYDINLKLLSDVLKANGGKIKGDKYYTTIQKPKTVAWEVSFEGLYPSERRVIKYDLGTEKTFEFNGKGVVLMGMIRQDVKDSNDNYIAILEAYIDGKKVETIEMPYDYIKRKYDIFYNYDLEEGPHKLVIKWINPNEKYAVQCKDMVVYSSIPAEPINPYK